MDVTALQVVIMVVADLHKLLKHQVLEEAMLLEDRMILSVATLVMEVKVDTTLNKESNKARLMT